MVMPIACSHPSGSSFRRFAKSWLIDGDGAMKRRRAGEPALRCRRSQCFRLRLQEPDPDGSPRGSRPPELPAGKRGGWHHDSVYPSFRLTSSAPRALNFAPKCTSQNAGWAATRLFESLKTKRLKKRVVQKADGRYLIYYEKV